MSSTAPENSPLQLYKRDLERPGFVADSAQESAVMALQQLFSALCESHPQTPWGRQQGALGRLVTGLFGRRQAPPQGLYFWGGVGRGKTYLMDLFFDSLPFEAKMRTHFHRFMRRVHQELSSLSDQQDPLQVVADRLQAEARVICFDEFFVVDITDAMILANLLDAMFARGMVLVATSNIAPEGLYENGLQRARFLPAIDLLQKHTRVLNVDGGVDYRLRALEQAPLYYLTGEADTEQQLQHCFENLMPEHAQVEDDVVLAVEGRSICAKKVAEDLAWFRFTDLCDGPRSQNDYIELAREFHTLILEGVPAFSASNDDQARRFIYLVDEFYDRSVKLIIAAAAPAHALYGEGRLGFEFQRTVSRLQEMQSNEYLARPHKP